jgi:prolyl-tRNA synthetase
VNWGRDCAEPIEFDLRMVVEGDFCSRSTDQLDDSRVSISRGIEVGHIFQLGTKYSEAMKATCLDNNGKAALMPMGCYGIGVSRIVAAAIEQNNDARGIIWPDAIAPFQIVITPIGYKKSDKVKDFCDQLYQQLSALGVEVLLDDRNERPGIMFADADLIGIPHRVVVGEKSLDKGQVEYKNRRAEAAEDIAQDTILDFLKGALLSASVAD